MKVIESEENILLGYRNFKRNNGELYSRRGWIDN